MEVRHWKLLQPRMMIGYLLKLVIFETYVMEWHFWPRVNTCALIPLRSIQRDNVNDTNALSYIRSFRSSLEQTFAGAEQREILYDKPVMNFYIQDLFVCTACPEGTYNVYIGTVNEFCWMLYPTKWYVTKKYNTNISKWKRLVDMYFVIYRFCHSW
jgi:hypothetical protein